MNTESGGGKIGLQLLVWISSVLVPIWRAIWCRVAGDAACARAAFGGCSVIVGVEQRMLPVWRTSERRFVRKDGELGAVILVTVAGVCKRCCRAAVAATVSNTAVARHDSVLASWGGGGCMHHHTVLQPAVNTAMVDQHRRHHVPHLFPRVWVVEPFDCVETNRSTQCNNKVTLNEVLKADARR